MFINYPLGVHLQAVTSDVLPDKVEKLKPDVRLANVIHDQIIVHIPTQNCSPIGEQCSGEGTEACNLFYSSLVLKLSKQQAAHTLTEL